MGPGQRRRTPHHNLSMGDHKNGVSLLHHSTDELAFYYKTTDKRNHTKNVEGEYS